MTDRGRHVLVRGEGSPPQGVLRRGFAGRAGALSETAQPFDHRSQPSGQAAPVDRVEGVLDQQAEFGVAVDGETPREEQRVRIFQAARKAIIIPGAGGMVTSAARCGAGRNPNDERRMRPSRPASLTWMETMRPISRCLASASSVGRNSRLSPAHSTADGGHCGRRLTRPARRAGSSGTDCGEFNLWSGIPCPATVPVAVARRRDAQVFEGGTGASGTALAESIDDLQRVMRLRRDAHYVDTEIAQFPDRLRQVVDQRRLRLDAVQRPGTLPCRASCSARPSASSRQRNWQSSLGRLWWRAVKQRAENASGMRP